MSKIHSYPGGSRDGRSAGIIVATGEQDSPRAASLLYNPHILQEGGPVGKSLSITKSIEKLGKDLREDSAKRIWSEATYEKDNEAWLHAFFVRTGVVDDTHKGYFRKVRKMAKYWKEKGFFDVSARSLRDQLHRR